MLQKIYISSLIIALIFSTTGYTITEHFCKMMDRSFADQECTMHDNMETPESMSCCENEDSDCGGKAPLTSSDCCETQSINKKVEDDFISFKQEIKNKFTSIIVSLSLHTLIEDENRVTSHILLAFDSSPPSSTNKIYIFNSVLLI